jgi:hypothetical protein
MALGAAGNARSSGRLVDRKPRNRPFPGCRWSYPAFWTGSWTARPSIWKRISELMKAATATPLPAARSTVRTAADLLVRHRDKQHGGRTLLDRRTEGAAGWLDPRPCPAGRQSDRPRTDPCCSMRSPPISTRAGGRRCSIWSMPRRPGLHDRYGPVDVFSAWRPGAVLHRCRRQGFRVRSRFPPSIW